MAKNKKPKKEAEEAPAESEANEAVAEDGADGSDEVLDRISALEQEKAALEDRLRRALADMANMRRRIGEDMKRASEEATMRIARELLPIADSFRLSLQADVKRDDFYEGVKLIESMLSDLLSRHGVKHVDAEGKPFDPNFHEAMAMEPRDDVPPGTVTAVHQDGYVIGDRVLRAARVVVSQAAEPPDEKSGDEAESSNDEQQN